MTTSTWNIGLSGDWNTSAYWSAGVPISATDAVISTLGDYTVSLTTMGAANSITLDSTDATFDESSTGQLNIVNDVAIEAGTAVLSGSNTIANGVDESGGLIDAGNANALGGSTFTFSGGEFLGAATETIANQLEMSGNIAFAASAGDVLSLNSSSAWDFNTTNPGSITFGDGTHDGTVVWYTTGGGTVTNPNFTIDVAGGTLKAGDAFLSNLLLSNASSVTVNSGATLDVAGFATLVQDLQGAGTITDSGAPVTLTVESGTFSGALQGALSLEVSNNGTLLLSGTNTFTGGTTVDSGSTLQLGNGGATGSIAGDIVDNGAVIYDLNGSFLQESVIADGGAVTYEGGALYTINQSETYTGATTVNNSSVISDNSDAFGSGALTLNGSAYVSTANQTISVSSLSILGNSSIAAAHGTTLTLDVNTNLNNSSTAPMSLTFGDGVDNGTIIWDASSATISDSPGDSIVVLDGTVESGPGASLLNFFTQYIGSTTVRSGATLNLGSNESTIAALYGGGTVVENGGEFLHLGGGNFIGVIGGDTDLDITGGVTLGGTNAFTTGSTTIEPGAALSLGEGGTTGSVPGEITDNGALYYNHSSNVAVTGSISGSGSVTQYGTGTTTIDMSESYSGGTNVTAGELSINQADAIGTGGLAVNGGEFLATASMSIPGALSLSGDATIAASTGTTLILNQSNSWTLNATEPALLTFGDASHAGTILWYTPAGSTIVKTGNYSVTVADGTLKAADVSFSFLTSNDIFTTIDSGATLDIAGTSVAVSSLLGGGTVTNSGAPETFTIYGGNFSGKINGPISLELADTVTLTGGGSYTGAITLDAGGTLNLADTTTRTVDFAAGGTLNITNGSGVAETVMLDLISSGDTVTGGAGNETFSAGATFAAGDTINGGAGTNSLVLAGNYTGTHALTLGASTLTDIQDIYLGTGFSYTLTFNAATLTSGHSMMVSGTTLASGNNIALNAGAMTGGTLTVDTGGGTNTVTFGGGTDIFNGGTGNDEIIYTSGFTATDQINGGGGTNMLVLGGNYTGANAVTMGASTLTNIQEIYLDAGHSYNLTTNVATLAAGKTMTIDGLPMGASDSLTFNGSADAGKFVVDCGAGTNTITGGTAGDTFDAGTGTDTFDYTAAAQSTNTTYDTISGMNFSTDKFNVSPTITGINTAITTGTLSTATFNTNLAAAANASHLSADHAVLFTPSAGTLSGQTFLIVDLNGTAGYQAGADLVIHLTGETGTLTTGDFL